VPEVSVLVKRIVEYCARKCSTWRAMRCTSVPCRGSRQHDDLLHAEQRLPLGHAFEARIGDAGEARSTSSWSVSPAASAHLGHLAVGLAVGRAARAARPRRRRIGMSSSAIALARRLEHVQIGRGREVRAVEELVPAHPRARARSTLRISDSPCLRIERMSAARSPSRQACGGQQASWRSTVAANSMRAPMRHALALPPPRATKHDARRCHPLARAA